MDPGQTCEITKVKIGGHATTWPATVMTIDQFGTWLHCPSETTPRSSTGEARPAHTTARIQLITSDEWWTAWWCDGCGIVDEDEFAAAVTAGDISATQAHLARLAADQLLQRLADRDSLFVRIGVDRLRQAGT